MPTPVKFLTMFGTSQGYGWSEVHWANPANTNLQLDVLLNSYILGVVAARQVMLGENAYVVGARVSYRTPAGLASNGKRQQFLGTAGKLTTNQSTSLAIEMQNSSFTRSKIIHIRGFWDEVEQDQVYVGDALADWQAALIPYINALKNGYGWMSTDTPNSAKGAIASYLVNTDGTVSFTVQAPDAMPLATVGTRQQVAFSKFHNSRSILNRTLQVLVESQVLMRTIKPVGADPTSSTGNFNYRAVAFMGYANSDSISIGERRMGKPLNRRPGRSRAKVLN